MECCYSAADTDLSDSVQGAPVQVKIYLTELGNFADLINQKTQAPIATKVPVSLVNKRGQGGWHYTTPVDVEEFRKSAVHLEVYRTNERPRTPTSVNAHLHFDDTGNGIAYKIDRMECERLGL